MSRITVTEGTEPRYWFTVSDDDDEIEIVDALDYVLARATTINNAAHIVAALNALPEDEDE